MAVMIAEAATASSEVEALLTEEALAERSGRF